MANFSEGISKIFRSKISVFRFEFIYSEPIINIFVHSTYLRGIVRPFFGSTKKSRVSLLNVQGTFQRRNEIFGVYLQVRRLIKAVSAIIQGCSLWNRFIFRQLTFSWTKLGGTIITCFKTLTDLLSFASRNASEWSNA